MVPGIGQRSARSVFVTQGKTFATFDVRYVRGPHAAKASSLDPAEIGEGTAILVARSVLRAIKRFQLHAAAILRAYRNT